MTIKDKDISGDRKEKSVDDIENELQEAKDKAQEYLDGWKRAQADFVNLKKEEGKRMEEIIRFANENLILDIIATVDDFERGISHTPKEIRERNQEWLEGLDQVLKNFEMLLNKYGVEKIKSVGQKFDPILHEAVGIDEPTSGGGNESGQIIEEFQSGYKMHEKVIRPARVKVIK